MIDKGNGRGYVCGYGHDKGNGNGYGIGSGHGDGELCGFGEGSGSGAGFGDDHGDGEGVPVCPPLHTIRVIAYDASEGQAITNMLAFFN